VTTWPAPSVTSMSLGSDWQSVERHHTSVPLVTVNDWALVPTFNTQGVSDVFDSRIDSCGFSPWAYSALSDSASTVMFAAVHSTGPAGALGVGVAVGPAVGVAAAEGAAAVARSPRGEVASLRGAPAVGRVAAFVELRGATT